jgi:hypothetical protein
MTTTNIQTIDSDLPGFDAELAAFYQDCERKAQELAEQQAQAARETEAEAARETEARRQELLPALPAVLHPFTTLDYDREAYSQYLLVQLPDAAPFKVFTYGDHTIRTAEVAQVFHSSETRQPFWSLSSATYYPSPDLAEIITEARRRFDDYESQMAEWSLRQTVRQAMDKVAPAPKKLTTGEQLEALIKQLINEAMETHITICHE